MSLVLGGATSDRVNCGTLGGVNHTSFSAIMWVNLSTLTTNRRFLTKLTGVGADPGWGWSVLNTTEFGFFWHDNSNTFNNVNYRSTGVVLATGVWRCIGVTVDQGGTANAKVKFYAGSLSAAMALASTDVSDDINTNPWSSAAGGDLVIGNRPTAFTGALQGSIGSVTFIENRVLTLVEMRQWQFRPAKYWAEQKLFMRLGANGTGTQPDWSGNGNAGTVTGATVGANASGSPWFGYDLAHRQVRSTVVIPVFMNQYRQRWA